MQHTTPTQGTQRMTVIASDDATTITTPALCAGTVNVTKAQTWDDT